MRHILLAITALGLLSATTACKTSEKNYREAYDKVMQKKEADKAYLDELTGGAKVYDNLNSQRYYVVGTDTLYTTKEYVRVTPDVNAQGAPALSRFNVVIGQFRQLFNAKSLASRLIDLGFDPLIVNNQTPTYYVVIGCTPDAAEALQELRTARDDKRYTPLAPCPWVLQPSGM